jgi:CDP-6-deoxy-D-xylo-4-hexulose-3-dehydrase
MSKRVSIEVPLAQDGLDEDEIEMVCSIFRSGNLTMGKAVQEFEQRFAEKIGVNHAVMVNSCSSANLLALELLADQATQQGRLKREDLYVAIPAILWPTSIWPIIQMGFKALLIDTKPNTLEIDFNSLIAAKNELGDQLVGVVLIHPLGKSLDLSIIRDLEESHGLFVVEDNAESLGAGNHSQFAGSMGKVGTFSFYYSHHITTVEGGMVVTNSAEMANRLLSMRAHGWTRNRLDREQIELKYPERDRNFLFISSGYNFRPMEFQGALGISQLAKLEKFIEKRISNVDRVNSTLKGSNFKIIGANEAALSKPRSEYFGPVDHSWMAMPILYSGTTFSQSEIHEFLNKNGVATRPILAGNFLDQPAGKHERIEIYKSVFNSTQTYNNSFMMSNHHNLTDSQLEHIEKTFAELIHIDKKSHAK